MQVARLGKGNKTVAHRASANEQKKMRSFAVSPKAMKIRVHRPPFRQTYFS
jgi:hypothetical protein